MAFTKVAPAGIGSTPGDGYRIGDSFLHSTGVEITNINATGILTAASLDISGAIDFDGHTELDNVNISGVSTFAGNIDANGDLDVDGHTNLDNVSIAGVTTIAHTGANQLIIKDSDTAGDNAHMRISFQDSGGTEKFFVGNNNSNGWLYLGSPSGQNNNIAFRVNGNDKFQVNYAGAYVNGDLTVNGTVDILDSIIHTGDTNTKIRFPAADTVTVETAGSEAFRIDSGGRVKIGTTSNKPAADNEAGIVFGDNTAGTVKKGIASFCADGAAPLLLTRRVSDGNVLGIADDAGTKGLIRVTSNDLVITAIEELRLSTGAGHSEKIRLTNAGRFGIGLTGPSALLHVKGSDNVLGVFESTDADALIQFMDNGTSDTILMGALGGDDLLLRCDPGNIVFKVANNNERLRITSSGVLESYSASDANPNFKFRSDDTNWHGYLNQTVHGATISTILSCGGTWTVDGTTYTATKDYNGSFGTAALIVHNQYNSTATGGELVFVTKANGSSTTDGAVTEKFRIKSGGEAHFYGNQTTAPEGDFGFRWDRNTYANFQLTNTNNTSVNAGARITLKTNIGTITGSYYNNGGFYLVNSANGYLNYYSNSVLRVNIDVNGNFTINPGTAVALTSSNGSVGKKFGIKSNANNVIIGETESSGNGSGLHIESRQSGRSGDARIAQIGLKNDASGDGQISFFTAPNGTGVIERMSITSDGTVNCLGTTALKVPTGTTAQRPTGTTGMLRYNTTTEELEAYGSNNFWFNVKDGKFQGEGDIGTASNPAYSGKQLKDLGKSSGTYYIKPQGYSGSAIQAYVDMTTNGGGWVLVAAFPLSHSNLTMSGNTSGLNESSVKNYATTVPSNNSAAFYNKNFMNYLFHQNATSDPYSTYSIAGVHGRAGNGYVLWEVRANSSNRNSTIDAFKSIYKTNEVNNKFDVRYYQNTSSNTLNNYVGIDPNAFTSYANYTYGRAGTSDNTDSYHYLIDDIAGGYQWAFRENIDDNPGNYQGYDLSNIFIR